MLTSVRRVVGERPEVAQRVVEVLPWPVIATAWVCIQSWNAARVLASNERRISSSSTVCATCESASRPPSGIGFADFVPGVSST